jgi:hypothetical protein
VIQCYTVAYQQQKTLNPKLVGVGYMDPFAPFCMTIGSRIDLLHKQLVRFNHAHLLFGYVLEMY